MAVTITKRGVSWCCLLLLQAKKEKQILKKSQEALRANAARLNVWVAQMQKELQEMAVAKAEQVRIVLTAAQ